MSKQRIQCRSKAAIAYLRYAEHQLTLNLEPLQAQSANLSSLTQAQGEQIKLFEETISEISSSAYTLKSRSISNYFNYSRMLSTIQTQVSSKRDESLTALDEVASKLEGLKLEAKQMRSVAGKWQRTAAVMQLARAETLSSEFTTQLYICRQFSKVAQ